MIHLDTDNCRRIPDKKNKFLVLLPEIKDRKGLLGEVLVEFFHWSFFDWKCPHGSGTI